jgi:hypothetical protein
LDPAVASAEDFGDGDTRGADDDGADDRVGQRGSGERAKMAAIP